MLVNSQIFPFYIIQMIIGPSQIMFQSSQNCSYPKFILLLMESINLDVAIALLK